MTKLPNRWWLIGPWAIFALLLLAWTAYWVFLSGETIKRLEQAKAGAPGEPRLSYEKVETIGFPFRLVAVLTGPRLDGPDAAFSLSAPRAHIAVNVLNPSQLMGFADSPIRWRGLDLDWSIAAERVEASARFGADGSLGEARLSLSKASIAPATAAGTNGPTQTSRLDLFTLAWRADPQDAAARQAAVTLEGFAPAGLKGFEGFTGQPFGLKAGLVVEQAGLIRFGPDPLSAWAGAGAQLRVERFQADPAGLKITANGALGVDAARRPTGALTLAFDDLAAGLRAVAQSSVLPGGAKGALDGLTVGQGLAGGGVNVPITAQDGRWRLGPVDLGPIDLGPTDLGPAEPLYPVR